MSKKQENNPLWIALPSNVQVPVTSRPAQTVSKSIQQPKNTRLYIKVDK